MRSEFKKERRGVRQFIGGIAECINGVVKYYLISNSMEEQVEEVKRLF